MAISQKLLLPLISTAHVSHQSSSDHRRRRRRRSNIIFRGLALLIFTGLLSVWAAIESSKGVAVTVVKADRSLAGGQRFNLMYVSNGKAARILIRASRFVESHTPLSGPNGELGVRGITLRLSGQNTSSLVEAAESRNGREFVLSLNPALLLKLPERNVDADVEAALLRSVARVRMWRLVGRMGPGESRAVEEMEEYVVLKASKAHAIDTGFFHNLVG